MADHVPQLEPKMLERVAALRGLPAVEAAFEVCAEEVERAMAEQIRISETESPTFAEKVRGELIMELLREYRGRTVPVRCCRIGSLPAKPDLH